MALGSKGLGRGLDALIPGSSEAETAGKKDSGEVDVSLIDASPHQPRSDFDEAALSELAASIKKHGVLQPLVVTPNKGRYELIAGERRLRAAKKAGLKTVPAIFREAVEHEKLEISLVENIQRTDLNPIEEAVSYKKLTEEFGYDQSRIAKAVGKSRSAVANKLRLLTLPAEMKRALREEKITEGHAKALLSVEDKVKREKFFKEILGGGFSVRDTEKLTKKTAPKKASREKAEKERLLGQLAEGLKDYLGTKVKIKSSRRGGKIEIEYYSEEELTRIYERIKGTE